jgi:hypothetical protein
MKRVIKMKRVYKNMLRDVAVIALVIAGFTFSVHCFIEALPPAKCEESKTC